MEVVEEAEAPVGRTPKIGFNPWAEDPPDYPVTDAMAQDSSPEPEPTAKRSKIVSASVCTCSRCPKMEDSGDQKCCHEVGDWQREYNAPGTRF